jgi:hypothetical protein
MISARILIMRGLYARAARSAGLIAAISFLVPWSPATTHQRGTGAGAGRAASANSAIVGHVADASGQPVSGAFVTALRRDISRGSPRVIPVSAALHAITNDRGAFRFDNLSPGPYYVVVVPQNRQGITDNRPNRSGYAITYYPDVVTATDAKPVVVSRGATATADVTVAPARLFVIAGSAFLSDGRPAGGGTLYLAHGDGLFGLDSKAVRLRADGTFLLAGLPPGTYFLQMREGAWPPPLNVIPKVSGAKVAVVDSDVTNIRVTPIEMVRATGHLLVDPAARPSLQPSTIEVAASPVDFNGNPGPQRPGLVRDDLTFEFRTWPSVGYIRVFIGSPEWILKGVRLNGVDVTDKDIDFRPGQEISGLEIEVIRRPGRRL